MSILILFFSFFFSQLDTTTISTNDKLVRDWIIHQRITPLKKVEGTKTDTLYMLVNLNQNQDVYKEQYKKIDKTLNIVGSSCIALGSGFILSIPKSGYSRNNKDQRKVYWAVGLGLITIGTVQIAAF